MGSTVDSNCDEPSLTLLLSVTIDRECSLVRNNGLGGSLLPAWAY